MNDILGWIDRLFTQAPYTFLSWPAVAMVLGTMLMLVSAKSAKQLAVVPRTGAGVVGVFTAPFIHTNWAHLGANLAPFLVLGSLILRRGEEQFLTVALSVIVGQGALLWLLGRKAAHVGMSGVIFGFFGWLLTIGWHTQNSDDVLVAGAVLLVYGGMLAGIAPARNGTSWEGHLFGLIVGAGAAWMF